MTAITTIPSPEEPAPALAWPTLALLAAGLLLFAGSSALYLADAWPWWCTVLANGLVTYWCFFTAWHESTLQAVSRSDWVNRWVGRVAFWFVVPGAGSRFVRYVHMQHHRFTGVEGADPDYRVVHGKRWTTPLRWAGLDVIGAFASLGMFRGRPRADKIEMALSAALLVALVAACVATGHAIELLVVLLLPQRLGIFQMGLIFDWLPHHGMTARDGQVDQFATTRNRIGLERLMTPVTQYQNYHLVHHLHPTIPFYRYITVWRRNEEAYLEHQPPLRTWSGRPLSADEYRKLRDLEHHH